MSTPEPGRLRLPLSQLVTLSIYWLGITTIRAETGRKRFTAVGSPQLEKQMPAWLGLSTFATERKRAS